MKKVDKTLTVSVAGHTFGYLDDALPDSFYVGITGCEGLNRFLRLYRASLIRLKVVIQLLGRCRKNISRRHFLGSAAAGVAGAAMAANRLSADDGGATGRNAQTQAIQSPGDCDGSGICARGHVHEGPLLCVQGWAVAPLFAPLGKIGTIWQDASYRGNRRTHGKL